MFGEGFENCWYKVPGVPSLELSGDLSFRVLSGSVSFASIATGGLMYLPARSLVKGQRDEHVKVRSCCIAR